MTDPSAQSPGQTPHDDALEAYLDGVLAPAEIAAFEARLAADPALRAEVELQRHIDRGVRGHFAYPAPPVAAPVPEPVRTQPGRGRELARTSRIDTLRRELSQGKGRWLAAAASILIILGMSWSLYRRNAPPPRVYTVPVAVAYQRLVDAGFQPESVCTSDAEFRRTVSEQFGQALSLPPTPGVELVGWAYGDNYHNRIMGSRTLVLMAKVEGRPVVAFIDDAGYESCHILTAPASMHVSSRIIGSLVVVEVTPLPQSAIEPRLVIPE